MSALAMMVLLSIVEGQRRYITFGETLVLLSFVDKDWGKFWLKFRFVFMEHHFSFYRTAIYITVILAKKLYFVSR